MFETDVVIIGAGPTGLFSIFQCGMHRLQVHVFDALDRIGGQCSALYPEKPIYDIPAHPKITGEALTQHLYEQAKPFNPVFHLCEQITAIDAMDSSGKVWRVTGSKGTVVHTRTILIAAGVGAFGPNRPPIEGIEIFERTSIHYFIATRETYRDKHVVIAGGGDSAVDWALSLSEIAASVSIVHRRNKFRAAPESEAKLKDLADKNLIRLVVPYQLAGLEGVSETLSAVIVETLDGQKEKLKADYLLPFFGLSMNLGPIADWGLHLTKNHITINPLTGETSTPGIYAVGDIATYDRKLKLILIGFAEAAQAAHHIRSYLHPDEIIHFEYSTTKGIPEGTLEPLAVPAKPDFS